MHCLYLPDGWVTCELYEKREVAVDFYDTLYLAEDCDPDFAISGGFTTTLLNLKE